MKTRSFGMNLWSLFSAAILFFVSSSCEGGECDVFSQRSVETNNTAEYLTHLLEEARKTCAYRGFPELVARFEPLISVTEASSQDSPNYDMDSINGSHVDAVSTDQPQSLDYWIWDPAEEYYCDPSSSNCPREPEVVTPHPVTLARKDIVLPRDVKSLTLNIVLDVENRKCSERSSVKDKYEKIDRKRRVREREINSFRDLRNRWMEKMIGYYRNTTFSCQFDEP
ncbi:hypothetical protein RRG08_053230 [Elysia crispata]|uniref:Uncharacterized protein n=1 Tax=Elysia crispata TaxID=231223 RepID=A0AAE1E1J3_9GAST|nr:hypothetical protein RRG08_053230 [Elysia crispata]